jgi:hypothetical protein
MIYDMTAETISDLSIGDSEVFEATAETEEAKTSPGMMEILTSYQVAEETLNEVNQDSFNNLRSVLEGKTFSEASEFLAESEIEWIKASFTESEIAANSSKKGKIFITKFLPGPYVSAKSVLLSALEQGKAFYDADGNPIGKSALSKEVSKENQKSPEEKLDKMLESMLKLLPQCEFPSVSRDYLVKRLTDISFE